MPFFGIRRTTKDFETASNVIYTGAAPNQHIMPLIDHMAARYGSRVICIGSNYIWAWENNRIMRESIILRHGSVPLERYVAIGEVEFCSIIDEIFDPAGFRLQYFDRDFGLFIF